MAVKSRLINVSVFAVAMAWVEAAVVLDLRVLVGRLQPYQTDPLPHFGGLGGVEIVREAATLAMLLAAGWLAGEKTRSRLAYSAFAFGVWDIFYYVFLIPLTGWPASLLDWDILFLIPLPWWGPVIAPIGISALLIVGGILAILLERSGRPACFSNWVWLPVPVGTGLVLYAFMTDAVGVSLVDSARAWNVLPVHFHWVAFLAGYLLMAVPVAEMARRYARILRTGELNR
jgi:hypothetical protein